VRATKPGLLTSTNSPSSSTTWPTLSPRMLGSALRAGHKIRLEM
jgi:hypothetical protein